MWVRTMELQNYVNTGSIKNEIMFQIWKYKLRYLSI